MPAPTRCSEKSTIATQDRVDQQLDLGQPRTKPFTIAHTIRGSQVTTPNEYGARSDASFESRAPRRSALPVTTSIVGRDRDRDAKRTSALSSVARSPDRPSSLASAKIYVPATALQIPEFKGEDLVYFYTQLSGKALPDAPTVKVVTAGYKPDHEPCVALKLHKHLVVDCEFESLGRDSDRRIPRGFTLVFADRRTYWEFIPEACSPSPRSTSDRKDDRRRVNWKDEQTDGRIEDRGSEDRDTKRDTGRDRR